MPRHHRHENAKQGATPVGISSRLPEWDSMTDRAKAASSVTEMCQKLLANPVIEEFRFDLEEIPAPAASS